MPSPTPAETSNASPTPVVMAAAARPDSAPAASSAAPSVSVETSPQREPPAVEAPQAAIPTRPAPGPVISRSPAPPKQDFKILAYIDKLKVLGIRAAGSDSKVLMSGRVYRLNDIVDYELGLRLTGVGATTLTFVDENGVVYTKSL